MSVLLAQRSGRWALWASALLGCVLACFPLFGVHGVESALVLGIALPPLCAAVGARIALTDRSAALGDARHRAGDAVVAGLLILAAPVLILALNALRVRNCAPLEGLAFIALGPGAGVVLASLLGACIGALPIAPWLATALAVALPLADIGRALYGFYATPAVHAYGHFFGYFPGALYDELIEIPAPLLSLRVVTSGAVVALLCLIECHYDRQRRGLRLRPRPGRVGLLVLMCVCATGVLTALVRAEDLGHRASVESISEALGGHAWSARCELFVPRELRKSRRQRLGEDCDFRVRQMERWFGLKQPGKVRVFLFRSAFEKRRLMGAGGTNIAKPWRREIYLQDDVWPHPVMPHELAHIVAGNAGRGAFRISGKLAGTLPDFALIEGVAVAAAWSTSSASGMTVHQWTRAMYDLGMAPELQSVFGTGFFGQQRRVAYTVTGSLLRYISDTYGASAIRRIYRSGELQGALGVSLPDLERGFRSYLGTIALPDSARALAKQRFEGTSIFSNVCPHNKAKLKQDLDGYLAADDAAQAEQTCRRLLAIDPSETGVRATLVVILARLGQSAASAQLFRELRTPPAAPTAVVASVSHALADEAWRNGKRDEARRMYRELLSQPGDRDALRTLQVKALAFLGTPRQERLLFGLLVDQPGQSVDGASALFLMRELRAERNDGLPHYLEARQLYQRERFAEAAELLATAQRLGLPTSDIAVEALRVEAVSRYGANQIEASGTLWQALLVRHASPALDAEADDWLARIADAKVDREASHP